MLTSDFDYELPEELIAQEPLQQRDEARMLVLHKGTGEIEHRHFKEIGEYLHPGDLLAMNDTRVTARRLFGKKGTGVQVEALLLKPLGNNRYLSLVKPGRRLKPGAQIEFEGDLKARVMQGTEFGGRVLQFEGEQNVEPIIEKIGQTPLPPYIHRHLPEAERYQTVYARKGGSAAAPTAGLHFTPSLLSALEAKGIEIATVTLDVGLDTFRPIKSEALSEHPMHGESYRIAEETVQRIAAASGRIVAVGTTSVRTLESAATGKRQVTAGESETRLFITPGYEFQVVDAMITNFHMPRTTMMALVSALAGREQVLNAYREAVKERYRFLSFGDAMLIL